MATVPLCVCVCMCVCPLIKAVPGLVIKMHYHPTVSREETNSLSLCLLSLCLILILSFIYSLTPSLQGCGEVVDVLVRGLFLLSLLPLVSNFFFFYFLSQFQIPASTGLLLCSPYFFVFLHFSLCSNSQR